ncbi:hypothetical protein PENSPDRAFT_193636 [Peniophora sp. CONT]|nr:hypothetical protein PENSPDRAFT_193636 [Peniophora sp. CONT]
MPDGETLVGAKPKGQREYNKGGNTTSCVGNFRAGDLFYPLASSYMRVPHAALRPQSRTAHCSCQGRGVTRDCEIMIGGVNETYPGPANEKSKKQKVDRTSLYRFWTITIVSLSGGRLVEFSQCHSLAESRDELSMHRKRSACITWHGIWGM